jgi:hypothetical protein
MVPADFRRFDSSRQGVKTGRGISQKAEDQAGDCRPETGGGSRQKIRPETGGGSRQKNRPETADRRPEERKYFDAMNRNCRIQFRI